MARKCTLCDKSSKKSASRSHSNIKTLRRQKPNLQKVNGLYVCTRCLKTAAKVAA
ncbi:MAG TPA: L28 family ribosomal protein [Candidatus Kapabacteria bacterium]|nr:L28 family ribosomal protein [Candidatus Kapabacteria bacterium]